MELRDYFNFNSEIDIRIKGHRIAIQHVLNEYLQGKGPDELLRRFPTLSMEKIYATILYYLANKEEVDAYMARVEKGSEERYQEWLQTVASSPEYIERRERLLKAREKWGPKEKQPLRKQGNQMRPRFLLDEDMNPEVRVQLQKRQPEIEVVIIGDPGVPPKSTPDPVILEWIERNNYIYQLRTDRFSPIRKMLILK